MMRKTEEDTENVWKNGPSKQIIQNK